MAARPDTVDMTASGLGVAQVATLAALGAAFWLLAAMMLRALVPMGALDGGARVLTLALVIPGTYTAVLLSRWLARLRVDQVGFGIAIVTAAALLLDGVAMLWFPSLYANDPAQVVACAGAIFWGAGVALLLGLAINRD